MSLIIQPKRWSMKPPTGVQLAGTGPLADCLTVWPANEGGGLMLRGGGRKPSVASATALSWVAGRSGIVPAFDGVASYVDSGITYSGLSAFSWGAWFLSTSLTNGQDCILGATNAGLTAGMLLRVQSGHSNQVQFFDVTNGKFFWSDTSIALNTWYHVVATMDGAGAMKMYLNGALQSTSLTAGSTSGLGASTLKIGWSGFAANTQYWTGRIDLPFISDRVLTVAEIQQLYVDPYCFMQPQSPQRKFWVVPASIFLPAWARGCNQVIGSGYVS